MERVFFVLFLNVLAPFLVSAVYPSLNDDVLGLIVFKADIQDPYGNLTSWNEEDESPCYWKGVRCGHGRVTELNLAGFRLSGKISRGLLRLQSLRKLSLAMNNFTGGLNVNFTLLPYLETINLSGNRLSGQISRDLFQECGSLRSLSLANNNFSGEIPESLGMCLGLSSLNLSSNQFAGQLPFSIWSLNYLRFLDLSYNLLEGEIPDNVEGSGNLTELYLQKNQFKGKVPYWIGSCLLLRVLDLSQNSFSGELPDTIRNLGLCRDLILRHNAFSGNLPEWVGVMRNLQTLDVSENNFSGMVPMSLGHLKSLKLLNLSKNSISGSLPETTGSCIKLQSLDVSHNSLSGEIPSWLNKLVGLQQIIFSVNRFTGQIPLVLENLNGLIFLNLSGNALTGTIPKSIGGLKSMNMLDLSGNLLNGSIPLEIGRMTSLRELKLQKNNLTGEIPTSIGNCLALVSLFLSKNNLSGPIPATLAMLTALRHVDLSFNSLTGRIPNQLANLPNLSSFNISHNRLRGELPGGKFFNTIPPSSVSDNPALCVAAPGKPCHSVLPKPIVLNPDDVSASTPSASDGSVPQNFTHKRKKKVFSVSALIAIGAAVVIVVGMLTVTVLNLTVRSDTADSPRADPTFSGIDELSRSSSTDVDSGMLVMFSGTRGFDAGAHHPLLNRECEVGRGGFGSVYKTVLSNGRPVAIKKLAVSSLVKSREEFERVVVRLGKARGHPNVVGLEGYYWTPALQLLIYEFVEGGNLHKRLHEMSGPNLTWAERFNVILGSAKSLAHLHQINIIHYNVKSSNILIDESTGEPKVSDYGLARLLPMLDRYVLRSKIQSSLGYMAPEFGLQTGKITEKCDVYSFGILALETVTGKRPVEYMEDDVVVLVDSVRAAVEEGAVEECVDERLQGKFPADEAAPVVKLGLICTSQVPSNRPSMAEVVRILEMIRNPSESHDELLDLDG
ncbi:unnamed protein product [Cuscuta campestris]|uniref:Protein kinase domain-containing protein n=1 Tax=Cuscuta campestris TaxID=132261 RepID=A0A484MP32_9ASTE|nr:unnamed protein product [Cuscuta campestris]